MTPFELPDFKYITDEHRVRYKNFVAHHIQHSYARELPDELWHYTDFNGLSGIIRSGSLYSTQVTCLNDIREQGYLGDLLHEIANERRNLDMSDDLKLLLDLEDYAYRERDFSTAYHFVTCFSESFDDLNQWRGYGGGECGYAIGFDSRRLLAALAKRPNSLLVPILYDDARQRFFARDVVENAEKFYLDGLSQGMADKAGFAREFFVAFAHELDLFASATKYPAFASERERRIVTGIIQSDLPRVEFRQKRSLLSRHLPLDWTGDDKKLPITRICIGPSSGQHVTRVSLALFLEQYNYQNLPITLSRVPYRVV